MKILIRVREQLRTGHEIFFGRRRRWHHVVCVCVEQ